MQKDSSALNCKIRAGPIGGFVPAELIKLENTDPESVSFTFATPESMVGFLKNLRRHYHTALTMSEFMWNLGLKSAISKTQDQSLKIILNTNSAQPIFTADLIKLDDNEFIFSNRQHFIKFYDSLSKHKDFALTLTGAIWNGLLKEMQGFDLEKKNSEKILVGELEIAESNIQSKTTAASMNSPPQKPKTPKLICA